MKSLTLHVHIYEEDGIYIAQCLDVNIATQGNTVAEAKAMIKEALELYLDDDLATTGARKRREARALELEYA